MEILQMRFRTKKRNFNNFKSLIFKSDFNIRKRLSKKLYKYKALNLLNNNMIIIIK